MSLSCLQSLIHPEIAPDDRDSNEALLKYALEVYGLVLTADDLEQGFPEDYEESINTTPIICDFEDVLTRVQKEINKNHTERVSAGKEKMKDINNPELQLQIQLAGESIRLTDDDMNEMLDGQSYCTRYLINVKEVVEKFKADQQRIENGDDQDRSSDGALSTADTEIFEIEIEDDEDRREAVVRMPKCRKQDHQSSDSVSINLSPAGPHSLPRPSVSTRRQRTVDDELTPIISNVVSLAPSGPFKPLLLPKSPPSVRLTNPPVSTYGKLHVNLKPRKRLVFTKIRKKESCKTISRIVNTSKSHVQTNGNATKLETLLKLKRTPNNVERAQAVGSSMSPTPSTSAFALNQATVAAKVELRMNIARAHIAEQAKNQTKKGVKGSEYLACHICGKAFSLRFDVMYRKHMMVEHSVEVDDENIMAFKMTADTLYKCRKCSVIIINNMEEHRHVCLPHVPLKAAFDNIEVVPNTTKPIFCGICNEGYESRICLRQHLTLCHKECGSKVLFDPQFRCGTCLQTFKDSVPLIRHCQNCFTSRPGNKTILELAQGLLYCDICNQTHGNIEETQQCYFKKRLIRCVLCLYTVISQPKFVQHMKVYHNRVQSLLACQFCDDEKLFPTRNLFEHVVDAHYIPALEDAERTQRTSRISSTSTPGGLIKLINTNRIFRDNPTLGDVTPTANSSFSYPGTRTPQQPQIRFVTSPDGGLQGYQLIPVFGGRLGGLIGMRTIRSGPLTHSVNILKSVPLGPRPANPTTFASPNQGIHVTKPRMTACTRGKIFSTTMSRPDVTASERRAARAAVREPVRIAPKPIVSELRIIFNPPPVDEAGTETILG